ncbi:MAG TPA: SRPBCC family protein [Solirubrobacteraceae bacterium]|nr:SRPBCC family protein [Solirubrobacteraceae bacterium]
MRDLRGSAATDVAAPPEKCVALLAAVDGYPTWYPEVIREVDVLERDSEGVPRRARTTVHLALGPLANDFHFEIAVATAPSEVVLSRVEEEPSDPERLEVRWQVAPGRLSVDVSARLSIPRFLPVGGAGETVAQGFVEAARRELDGSSPKASASSS